MLCKAYAQVYPLIQHWLGIDYQSNTLCQAY